MEPAKKRIKLESNSKKEEPSDSDKDRVQPCPICGKMISCATMTRHVRNHQQSSKRFKCDGCEFATSTRYSLSRHVAARHNTVKPFRCENCPSTFATKPLLTRHSQNHISTQCTICHKTIKLCSLRNHMNTHTGNVCPAMFSTKVSLKGHQQTVHVMGQDIFKCDHCEFASKTKSMITHHKQNHHPEVLPSCTKCQHRHASTSICTFVCIFCNGTYRSFYHIHYHQQIECTNNHARIPGDANVYCSLPPQRTFPDSSGNEPPNQMNIATVETGSPSGDAWDIQVILQPISNIPVHINTKKIPDSSSMKKINMSSDVLPFVPQFCQTCGLKLHTKEKFETHIPCPYEC